MTQRPGVKLDYDFIEISLPESGEVARMPLPKELLYSTVYFRSNRRASRVSGLRELPRMVYSLLENEPVPLEAVDEECAHRVVQPVLEELLKYPFGLIRLFKNTALYLSPSHGTSGCLIASCSIASISYLGLEDGVFLARGKDVRAAFHYLMGIQLYNRGLHKHCDYKRMKCVEYDPHYEFYDQDLTLALQDVADKEAF